MTSFYAHGRAFGNEKDFWEFCRKWPDEPCDIEEFKHQMRIRIEEIEMNMKLRQETLTNREAYQILRMSTDWITLPEPANHIPHATKMVDK